MARLALAVGVLGGALLIGALLSPLTWWPSAREQLPPAPHLIVLTEEASRALLAGNLPQARQRIDEVLAQHPRHAPTLLFQACLALEAAAPQTAMTALEQLQGLVPEGLEPQLLQRMLESRVPSSRTGWRASFLHAWAELGHPSFADSPLLPEFDPATQGFAPMDAWKHASSDAARTALVLASPELSEESARWLMAQVSTLDDVALVQAASAALLSAELLLPLRNEARAAVYRRLVRLVEASPLEMQPQLVLLWAQVPEESAFSAQELERLESIAALPHWKATSFSQTFLEAHAHLKEAGVPYPSMGAYHVALWSNTHGAAYLLTKRAEVTRKQLLPGSRQRLGSILWAIGSRLSEQSTFMERLVGLQLMQQGAADQENERERERVGQLLNEARALRRASDMASLERWPMPSLWEEVAEARARDELAHRREFAAPLTEPERDLLQPP